MEKFRFETSFDNLSPGPGMGGASADATTRAYTQSDLETARQEGLVAGVEEGIAQERQTREHLIAQVQIGISEALAVIDGNMAAMREILSRQAIEVGVAIARKIAPEQVRRQGIAEIEGLIRHCLPDLAEEPRIVVRLPNDMLSEIQAKIDELATESGYAGRIILIVDDDLTEADCRIEWADGGAARDMSAMWQQIDEAVARVLSMPAEASGGIPMATEPAAPQPQQTEQNFDTDPPAGSES